MGASTSTEQKYRHLQSNFHHCAEELARLEFEIEFSNIEDGTPHSTFLPPHTMHLLATRWLDRCLHSSTCFTYS
jgi:hypothetical protein